MRLARLAPLALLPQSVLGIAKEIGRHLLRRPVVGIAAAARSDDNRWLLIRRAERVRGRFPEGPSSGERRFTRLSCVELAEEAGVDNATFERVVGVYSRPDRDPRFHAVTVVVRARIAPPTRGPMNPLEIREARLFAEDELPSSLGLAMTDMLADARRDAATVLE